ncbi:alkaline phosphatase [Gammaproteobacteria bacterium]|nr:alkaline phosphatase [Gammaproteobacteria bacterium]
MLRRTFIRLVANTIVLALLSAKAGASGYAKRYAFQHGVASGDPLADGIMLWTRISGAYGEKVSVVWEVARDAGMQSLLLAGHLETDESIDYTVKVDVRRLPADTRLYYRFTVGDIQSPVGMTRTLPVGSVDLARFAVVSCSNYPAGFFYAYREVAQRDDLNAVIHLGDYIYEYGAGQYATERAEELGRQPDPPTELLTLGDYRKRHAQYKSDRDSQAMHRAHPVIAIWDDHEIANEGWKDGADNHGNDSDRDEGLWQDRRDAAMQAYFEWMPIRGEANGSRTRIFRAFQFGDLLNLILLDTRFYSRERQPDISATDGTRGGIEAELNKVKRRMLGRRQERWLRKRLKRSTMTWNALAQQVLVSPIRTPDLEPILDLEKPSMVRREVLERNIGLSKGNPPLLLDTWDGYPWARQRLLRDIKRYGGNTVVLSGDLHTPLAGNLNLAGEKEAVAVEFMTGSVTSPGFAEYLPERKPGMVRDATLELNPNLRYMETDHRGWLCITFTHAECIGEWHLVDSVRAADYASKIDKRLAVDAGNIAAGLYEAADLTT